jgi:hypothetical protein
MIVVDGVWACLNLDWLYIGLTSPMPTDAYLPISCWQRRRRRKSRLMEASGGVRKTSLISLGSVARLMRSAHA